jgi:hypothetical protein
LGLAYKFTWKNVINGAIEYIPKKTKEDRVQTVRVPLSETAKEIMERYRDIDEDMKKELIGFLD